MNADLNDLRVFDRVAALRSFSAGARALGLPKSNVSRSISRLEAEIGARLLQRTTREVTLTQAGAALAERCHGALDKLGEALDYVAGFNAMPRGRLRISAGVGFGINVLAEQLPKFLARCPEIDIDLDLSGRPADLVSESIDVAVRLGPMPDSGLIATRLGAMNRYLCAAPAYLRRRGKPKAPADLGSHDAIEMPAVDGRARTWSLRKGQEVARVDPHIKISVNEALTIHRLVLNGAGVGILSGYLCAPEIAAGRLLRLVPEWTVPALEVHLVFPSKRELAPAVRAFVDFMKSVNKPGQLWQADSLAQVHRT